MADEGAAATLRIVDPSVAAEFPHAAGYLNTASLGLPPAQLRRRPALRIRAATRAGRIRVCFHLYNSGDDVERVVAALRG